MIKALVVHPDAEMKSFVAKVLAEKGFEIAEAADSASGIKEFYRFHPDLVVLGERLPLFEGEELCALLHRKSTVPIIVLIEKANELNRVRMLEMGANTYVYPVSREELLARVDAVLRRYKKGDIEFDHRLSLVRWNGREFKLTPTEFRLFSCLVFNEGRVVPYSKMISEVWGRLISLKTLHFYLRSLRQKLSIDSTDPYRLLSYRGEGYCFCRG